MSGKEWRARFCHCHMFGCRTCICKVSWRTPGQEAEKGHTQPPLGMGESWACEVQETFLHAGSSLQKRALGLCWSCFSPAPSLPARCILMSTFTSLCPHAWGTFRPHSCDSKPLLLPLSLMQQSPLPPSHTFPSIPSPSPFLPLAPQQMTCFAITTRLWDVPVVLSLAAGWCHWGLNLSSWRYFAGGPGNRELQITARACKTLHFGLMLLVSR